MRIRVDSAEEPELDVASLIDMVFLLLIYFMVTASLVKSEGDLSIRLPGVIQQAQAVDMPDEQVLEVRADSRVFLNGRAFEGEAGSEELPELVGVLERYRQAAAASGNRALITLWAEDDTPHQRVIDVMNACAAACIEYLTFAGGAED